MSIDRISVDTATLPTALLPTAKAHARVEHTRDDPLFITYIAASISMIERKCNVSLNPAVYLMTPDELAPPTPRPACGYRMGWALPVNNANAVLIVQSGDPGAPDISTDFQLWSPDYGGSASSYLVETAGQQLPGTARLTVDVGVTNVPDLAPAFLGIILRLTASMYENREASTGLFDDTFADELVGLWRPFA